MTHHLVGDNQFLILATIYKIIIYVLRTDEMSIAMVAAYYDS